MAVMQVQTYSIPLINAVHTINLPPGKIVDAFIKNAQSINITLVIEVDNTSQILTAKQICVLQSGNTIMPGAKYLTTVNTAAFIPYHLYVVE